MIMAEGHGHKVWLVPDGYLPDPDVVPIGPTGYFSHESVCIVNDGDEDAHCELDVYFEDRDPIKGIPFTVGAERSLHLRLDQVKDHEGNLLPRDTCYSLRVRSDKNVVVQHSRLDTTQTNMTLFTTMAYPVE